MTALEKIIKAEISAKGPISIARYMDLCSGHPEYGYYTSQNPIGAKGDFITAPEISQLFGEMIGIWLLSVWHSCGAPAKFILAELGPGHGTLMADILRVAKQDQMFLDAMHVYLVETSPRLRKFQRKTLKSRSLNFCDHISELPELPLFLIANEFFDALPCQQFVKSDIGWQERLIKNAPNGFEFSLAKPIKNPELDKTYPHLANGIIVETSTLSQEFASIFGAKIQTNGGAALVIDYGDKSGFGDTLQALKKHSSTDPLTQAGQVDLTCHVQFQPLQDSAKCDAQFTTQGHFLENMGITSRAHSLADKLDEKRLNSLISGHHRLVHPDEMGKLFKVMALRPKNSPPLPGFDQ